MKLPTVNDRTVKLPLTRLHCVVCGKAEPLIMVPATISEAENWLALIQFMSLKFKTYFFELPGHGQSKAFRKKFSTDLVAETVEQLANKLNLGSFNLMGFSFGGILVMKTLERLEKRIKRVIVFAPHVDKEALLLSGFRRQMLKTLEKVLEKKTVQRLILDLAHDQKKVEFLVNFLSLAGKIEVSGPRRTGLKRKLLKLPTSTLEVLVEEIKDILNFEGIKRKKPFKQTCYLAMSVNDPLLDFEITEKTLRRSFNKLVVKKLYFPYHQPPKPFKFEELKKNYGQFLEEIK